jgi:hypoxanthine phosphoribosyltransferase
VTNQPSPFVVLLDRDTLTRRIRELAAEIDRAYPDAPPMPIAIMEGARTFAAELCFSLRGQPPFSAIYASSYGDGQVSNGAVEISGADFLDVRGRRVLLIEDIVDTGRTLEKVVAHFAAAGACDVRVAALLSKPARRLIEVRIEHLGFEIDDHFVIGFGLDVGGRYRELPHIAVYDEALEHA